MLARCVRGVDRTLMTVLERRLQELQIKYSLGWPSWVFPELHAWHYGQVRYYMLDRWGFVKSDVQGNLGIFAEKLRFSIAGGKRPYLLTNKTTRVHISVFPKRGTSTELFYAAENESRFGLKAHRSISSPKPMPIACPVNASLAFSWVAKMSVYGSDGEGRRVQRGIA
jgi:hypothetical protein